MARRSKLEAVVTEAVGIYGTSPTCHLSALARIPGYKPEQLRRAVEEQRTLVRVRVMRRSVYVLGLDFLPTVLAATRREVVKVFQAAHRQVKADYRAFARKVEAFLAGGPRTSAEIRARVDPQKRLGGGFQMLLGRMASEFRIVRAASTGSWRSDRLDYARWRDWVPEVDPGAMDEAEGKRRLARAYVAAYGPVTVEDLAWWAGWTKQDTRAAAEGLDLSREGRAPKRLPGVRLLPVWDCLMVAWRHRDRLLDPGHAPLVYDRFGNATSVVLDAGRVVGVWDLGKDDDPLSVKVAPLGRWPKRRWAAVEEEAGRIGAMLGSSRVEVLRRKSPVNLLKAPRNRFLAPLSG